jgi:predicted DNA-binding transcriptional regulator AlpA
VKGIEIVTVDDLENFKLQLLKDLENLINAYRPKKWLKTHEVAEMLGMSAPTLQSLRNKGLIPYRKLGGICYFNIDEIDEAMKSL